MEDATVERTIRFLIREIVRLSENTLQLSSSVLVLKATVAGLTGEDPKQALAQFRKAEQTVLDSNPDVLKMKELSELLDLWEKHPPKPLADS
jgi:two-component sensor histidine kinase